MWVDGCGAYCTMAGYRLGLRGKCSATSGYPRGLVLVRQGWIRGPAKPVDINRVSRAVLFLLSVSQQQLHTVPRLVDEHCAAGACSHVASGNQQQLHTVAWVMTAACLICPGHVLQHATDYCHAACAGLHAEVGAHTLASMQTLLDQALRLVRGVGAWHWQQLDSHRTVRDSMEPLVPQPPPPQPTPSHMCLAVEQVSQCSVDNKYTM
jgi:hypothetical protein